jgi:hypothetical protein
VDVEGVGALTDDCFASTTKRGLVVSCDALFLGFLSPRIDVLIVGEGTRVEGGSMTRIDRWDMTDGI